MAGWVKRCYLVVRADGEVRTRATKTPKLRGDEVAFPLIIRFPEGWGRIATQILTIDMPEPPEAEVDADVDVEETS